MDKAQYKKLVEELMAMSINDGLATPKGARAMANALFITCRMADDFSEQEWTNNIALLSGMACGALMKLADKMAAMEDDR